MSMDNEEFFMRGYTDMMFRHVDETNVRSTSAYKAGRYLAGKHWDEARKAARIHGERGINRDI